MTAADLAALPEDGFRHELRAGLLLAEPQPFPRHAQVEIRLIEFLAPFVRERSLGQVLSAAGFLLSRDPDTVRGPDVSFIARKRWEAFGDPGRFFPGAPDLAVEVLSPSNRKAEMGSKIADYLAAGAREVWIVDPARRSVTVFRDRVPSRRFQMGDTLTGGDLLPGFSFAPAALFAP